MKTRIIVAAIGLPLLLVVLVVLPPIYLAILLAAMCFVGVTEFYKAVSGAPNTRILVVTLIFAALTPVAVYFIGQAGFAAIIMPLMAYNFVEAIIVYEKEREIKLEDILISLFSGALIPYFLSSMLSLRMMEKGRYFVVLVCVITMISDSGAYFTGYFLGKHHVTPRVSPNKTLEGYIGSLLSAIVGVMLFGLIASMIGKFEVDYIRLLIYAVCGNLFTQTGDLAFSLIKRHYGIKDYGNLLPGHGGVLDRFDSMIFTAPVILTLISVFPAF